MITGGASSGKSELGERIATEFGGNPVYVATMEPFGEEGTLRVKRHRALRADKGFSTLESYTNLSSALTNPLMLQTKTVLLECLTNLLANEMFSPNGSKMDVVLGIQKNLQDLFSAVSNVVVITGEIFSDGKNYPTETMAYIENLGKLNCFLAKQSDIVIKTIVGIPMILKGKKQL
ncbi:MAG: bifunctional adenosylcobinamide kinase/adenosylcobinamide-phosphate guanylyltransferase [Oscillospiraceae bacterium]